MPASPTRAQMAELVDALASGASVRMDVEVRVLFWAPSLPAHHLYNFKLQSSPVTAFVPCVPQLLTHVGITFRERQLMVPKRHACLTIQRLPRLHHHRF